VLRALKLLKTTVSSFKMNDKGYFCFAGISKSEEINVYLVTPFKSNLRCYTCSSKFNTSMIESYFEQSKYNGLMINITGETCFISIVKNDVRMIKKISVNLTKRHSKGGQSSVRFSRLAEESRHNYISIVLDFVKEYKYHTEFDNIVICGGEELGRMLEKELLICKYKARFMSNTVKEKDSDIMNIFARIKEEENENEIKEVLKDFEINMDYYVFGDEIKEYKKSLEAVLVVEKYNEKCEENVEYANVIKVPLSSRWYATVEKYGGVIGKLFFCIKK
jgi:peptide subunit release factor 1 (eRF1)